MHSYKYMHIFNDISAYVFLLVLPTVTCSVDLTLAPQPKLSVEPVKKLEREFKPLRYVRLISPLCLKTLIFRI